MARLEELDRTADDINAREAAMNVLLFELYDLTPQERRLVEAG